MANIILFSIANLYHLFSNIGKLCYHVKQGSEGKVIKLECYKRATFKIGSRSPDQLIEYARVLKWGFMRTFPGNQDATLK